MNNLSIEDMVEYIQRTAYLSDPIVRLSLDSAREKGFSVAETAIYLSYFLLTAKINLEEHILELHKNAPQQIFLTNENN